MYGSGLQVCDTDPVVGSVGCVALPVFCLVSLVSVWDRNWCYLCGRIETIEECEIIEIASIHAVFMHVAENMVGWRKRLGEYPTLSAILFVTALLLVIRN